MKKRSQHFAALLCLSVSAVNALAGPSGFGAMARRLHMHIEERGMGIVSYRSGDKAFESSVDPGPCFVPSDPKESAKFEKRLRALDEREGPWMTFSYGSPVKKVSLETINSWNAGYEHRISRAYLGDDGIASLGATFFSDPEVPQSARENFIRRFAKEVDDFNACLKKADKDSFK